MDAQLCKHVVSNVGVKSANPRQRLCSQSFQVCRRACTKSAKSQQGRWCPSCALSLQLAADEAPSLLVRSKTRTLMPITPALQKVGHQVCGSKCKNLATLLSSSATAKKSKNVDTRQDSERSRWLNVRNQNMSVP